MKMLRNLECELSSNQGKLLFSSQDAAKVIAEFYLDFMRNPLRKEMEGGAVGRQLTKFFSGKEFDTLPDSRHVDTETLEGELNRAAARLLQWLSDIASDKVDLDIQRVLEEHERLGDHMKLSAPNPHTKVDTWTCKHVSEFVEIHCYELLGENLPTIFLRTTKGFGVSDEIFEPGWNYPIFPQYRVVKME